MTLRGMGPLSGCSLSLSVLVGYACQGHLVRGDRRPLRRFHDMVLGRTVARATSRGRYSTWVRSGSSCWIPIASASAPIAAATAIVKLNRVLKKQPIGYLVAWLREGQRQDLKTAADHKAVRLDRSEDGPMSFTRRVSAREYFTGFPDAERFLELEPPPCDGQSEPTVLR